ncbi:MAG: hypothetical protein ACOYZ7_14465 [Chloroflexota bacterium]
MTKKPQAAQADGPANIELEPDEIAVVDDDVIEGLTAETVRLSQSSAGTVEAADVHMQQSGAQTIQAQHVEMRQSGAVALKAAQVEMHGSGAVVMHAESVLLKRGGTITMTATQISGEGIRGGVVVGQEVHAGRVRAGLLLARRVEGPVETTLDQRGALTLGVALGLVFGLLSLVRALLVRRDE